jgi:DNA helicase-4
MSDHDFQLAKIRMLPEIQRVWQSIVALSNEWPAFNQYINLYVQRTVWLATHDGTKNEVRIFEELRKSDQPRIHAYVILLLIEIRARASQKSNGIAALMNDAIKYMQEHADFYEIDDVFIDEINQILAQQELAERIERERQAEKERIEREQQEKIELAKRIARNQKAEAERIERERQAEKERIEREQKQIERAKQIARNQKAVAERIERERQAEKERIEREQQAEKERIERERQAEKERIERERQAKAEQIARERAERERIAQEQAEREREAQIQRTKYNAAAEKIWQVCAENFFAVDAAFQSQSVIPQSDLSKVKATFLREWFTQHLPDGATQPDDDQLNAIGSVHGNVQVIARAGSGKTSTLVYRVFFLIKHCRVNANEIMMLAFNRKAANEMRERLLRLLYPKVIPEYEKYKRERRAKMRSDQIDEIAISLDALTHLRTGKDIPLPFIMTFHGLVHNVANPSETLIYDTRDPEGAIQSKSLQSLIDAHIRVQDMQGRAIRQLMLHYFRSEWIDIEDNQYGLNQSEFLAYRRSIVNLSLQGHPVKSYGEKKIADFLFTHSVAYSYEPNIVIGKVQYRPDFAIWKDKQRIIIEYVGLQGHADYDALLEQKRKAYDSQKNLVLIELTPDDIKDIHAFERRMLAVLKKYNIPFRQLDDDEIWELIKDRAVGGFSRLMNGFIQKCRQLLINPVDLDKRIRTHRPLTKGNLEVEFAKLARTFYQEYIDYCVNNNVIDFSTLMQRATQLIRDGKSDFSKRHSHGNITQIRFLSIDEFQDFSVLFYELLSAMRGINPTMQLFCVGDDWQAINRFAGADTRFFTDFERYIGPRTVCHITSNYRSARRIVALGNAVMQDRGVPANAAQSLAGLIFIIYIDDFVGNEKESEYFGRYGYDLVVLSRLLNMHVQNKRNVTVLSRTSAPLEDVFPKIRQLFDNSDNQKLMRSTTHGYKGLEQESIILWDVTDRQYPMLHTHWIFGRILGDTLEQIIEDERRLFYVGVTRASKTLYIVTRRQSMSPFLAAAIKSITVSVTELSINTLPPIKSLHRGAVIVRLTGGTFSVKDAIKQNSYKWNQARTAWEKILDVDEFSPASLARESWISQASNITVTCVDETENVLHTYLVNGGRMSKKP